MWVALLKSHVLGKDKRLIRRPGENCEEKGLEAVRVWWVSAVWWTGGGGREGDGAKTGVVRKINRHRLEKINDVDSRLRQLSIIVLFPWPGCGHVVKLRSSTVFLPGSKTSTVTASGNSTSDLSILPPRTLPYQWCLCRARSWWTRPCCR